MTIQGGGNGDYRLREIERRLTNLENDMRGLDQHGSRGLEVLRETLRGQGESIKGLDDIVTKLIFAIVGVVFLIIGAVAVSAASGLVG